MNTTTPPHTQPAATSALAGEPEWLPLEPEPVYAVLHVPTEPLTACAALLLPAFGWDEECSYRRRRDWATQLASAGVTAGRFDFPGHENSAGSAVEPGRAQSWVTATVAAARWLRGRSGCERLTAIGVGVGALIAYRAVMDEAPIDDLILWGVRASGRAYVRELRAYAAVTASATEVDPPRADGAIGIGGHIMSRETAAELSAVNLTKLRLPEAERRRVLLIGRDRHGIDAALRDHLTASGADLTLLESEDYHALMSPPDLGLRPARTVSATVAWITAAPPNDIPSPPRAGSAPPVRAVSFDHHGIRIRERLTTVETRQGALRGVISEPSGEPRAPFCLVTVNSGALRHTGPNRMFVEIGRRAAGCGVVSARFDLPGLGDSDGTAVRSFERDEPDDLASLEAIGAIYDHLEEIGLGHRFVAAGFSLGGYLTIRIARADPRVTAALAVNPTGFLWTDKQRKRMLKDLIAVAGPDALLADTPPNRLPRALRPLADRLVRSGRSLDAAARRRLAHSDLLWRIEHRREVRGLCAGLDDLTAGHRRVLLLLSEEEQLLRMLRFRTPAAKLKRCVGLRVETLPDRDHLLRPLRIQELVIDRFVDALTELGASGGPAPASAPQHATPVEPAGSNWKEVLRDAE